MSLQKGKGALKLKGDDGSVKKKKKKKDKQLSLVETDDSNTKPKVKKLLSQIHLPKSAQIFLFLMENLNSS